MLVLLIRIKKETRIEKPGAPRIEKILFQGLKKIWERVNKYSQGLNGKFPAVDCWSTFSYHSLPSLWRLEEVLLRRVQITCGLESN